jgi:RimJ/RimL family protein N-acetyltransferase
MQDTLFTERLVLRPVTGADVVWLQAQWDTAGVRRFLFDDERVDMAQASAVLEDSLALASRGLGLWALEPRSQAAAGLAGPLGCAGLVPVRTAAEFYPPAAGGVEPIVALAPAAWRRGYATEALTALVAHAGKALGLTRLCAAVDVPNVESLRLVERLGFRVVADTAGPRYPLRHFELTVASA